VFAAPPVIETQVFARVPDELRAHQNPRHQSGVPRDCFIEGPSFDRDGNLYIVNIPYGQVFKVSPAGAFSVVASYDGEPNGLKIHRDGRIFIADHSRGLMVIDPAVGRAEVFLDRPRRERFKGLNDLHFAKNGDLYFTDQGESGLHDPTGRLWRLRPNGRLDLLLDNVPSPNGLILTPDEGILYLAVTRGNAVWRVPLHQDGSVGRVGIFIQMSGGMGPDGMAMDSEGQSCGLPCRHGVGVDFQPAGPAALRAAILRWPRHHQCRLWRSRRQDPLHHRKPDRDGTDCAGVGAGITPVLAPVKVRPASPATRRRQLCSISPAVRSRMTVTARTCSAPSGPRPRRINSAVSRLRIARWISGAGPPP
jgi:gluconolactonase